MTEPRIDPTTLTWEPTEEEIAKADAIVDALYQADALIAELNKEQGV